MIRARLAEAHLALVLLLRLPLPRLRGPIPAMSATAWAWPIAGIPVGLAMWGVHAGALFIGLPPLAAALAAIAAALLLTGALHADGLADLFDGLWGGTDRDRRLEIMRDSRIGSYGVLALIVALGLQASAIAAAAPALPVFLGAAMVSRMMMVPLAGMMRPARTEGLGHGAAGPGAGQLLAASAIALFPYTHPAHAVFAAAGAAALVGLAARIKIGGQTGDVLGAGQTLAETAWWLALAALAARTVP